MKPLKTKVSITLDSTIVDKIKVLSEEDDRSFSQYINWVLKEYILKKETLNNTDAVNSDNFVDITKKL